LVDHVFGALLTPPHLMVQGQVFEDVGQALRTLRQRRKFSDAPIYVWMQKDEAGERWRPNLAFVEAWRVVQRGNFGRLRADNKEALAALRNKACRVYYERV